MYILCQLNCWGNEVSSGSSMKNRRSSRTISAPNYLPSSREKNHTNWWMIRIFEQRIFKEILRPLFPPSAQNPSRLHYRGSNGSPMAATQDFRNGERNGTNLWKSNTERSHLSHFVSSFATYTTIHKCKYDTFRNVGAWLVIILFVYLFIIKLVK